MSYTQAFVLITVEVTKPYDVLHAVLKLEDIILAYIVAGPYDIIAFVQNDDPDIVGKTVIQKIQDIPGVIRTMTCIAIAGEIHERRSK